MFVLAMLTFYAQPSSAIMHQTIPLSHDHRDPVATLTPSYEYFSRSRTGLQMELMSTTRITVNNYQTNQGYHTFVVPVGVTSLIVQVHGARGGGLDDSLPAVITTTGDGLAHVIYANVTVTSGQNFYMFVGRMGLPTLGGFNGGGAPLGSGYNGGGGASDIRTSLSLTDRFLVAAGGAGDYKMCGSKGGNGGYPSGSSATLASVASPCAGINGPGSGGNASAGGDALPLYCTLPSNWGSLGQGGDGCTGGGLLSGKTGGSGGGGGYYGGGGGFQAGGGGGSSFIAAPAVATNMGLRYSGGGYIYIKYTVPYPDNAIFYDFASSFYSYTVPVGISLLWVELHGAWGNCIKVACGGLGGMITATLSVTPGEVLQFYIGGEGKKELRATMVVVNLPVIFSEEEAQAM